jgi:hypothetical protein
VVCCVGCVLVWVWVVWWVGVTVGVVDELCDEGDLWCVVVGCDGWVVCVGGRCWCGCGWGFMGGWSSVGVCVVWSVGREVWCWVWWVVV